MNNVMVGDQQIGVGGILHNMRTTYNTYVEELQPPFQRVAREDVFADGMIVEYTKKAVEDMEKVRELELEKQFPRLYGLCTVLNFRLYASTLLPLYETHLLQIGHDFSRMYFWWFTSVRKDGYFDACSLSRCDDISEEERKEVIRMWYDIRIMFLNKIIELYESK